MLLAICLFLTGGMGFAAYQYLKSEYQRNAEVDIRLQLQALQDEARLELGGIANALTFLVDQVESHLSVQDPESIQRLSYDFLSFVRTAKIYDQIRLIDMSGNEMIRANYNAGKPALVPADELQRKTNRYYFQEGIKLKRGEVYVSRFDLNIEHGEIEQPIKPTIRLVEPAFNVDGQQVGMVVVNVLGAPLLTRIAAQAKLIPVEHVALLNRDGYWLQGPVAKDLWAFIYPERRGRSLAARMPEIWQQIHDSDRARVRANGGTYLSATFYPARIFGREGLHVERAGERFWKMVAYYPDSFVEEALTDQYRLIVAASTGSGVALAIILLGMLRLRQQSQLRRVAEENARQQAAESARSKAIVNIAGGMAHEFNNILAGILGSAYLLRSKLDGQPELCGRLDTIEQLGDRASDLVQLLMTFAQIDYWESRRLLLNAVVADKVEEMRQSLPENISLKISITEIPLFLTADQSKLEKMLRHLFSNAVDALAEVAAPELKVSLGLAEDGVEPEKGTKRRFACLALADNGCGIAPENLPNIFDPFYTTKGPGQGTGMGLALVHGVVHALDGDIKVADNHGQGTIVQIYLPLEESDSA